MNKPVKLHDQPGVKFLSNDNLRSISFFVPLPTSITVPHRHAVMFDEADDGKLTDAIRFINSQGVSRRIRTRVLFQKVKSLHETRQIKAAIEAVEQFFAYSNDESLALNLEGIATVAHLSVITSRDAVSDERLTELFDEAMSQLRGYLKTHYVVDRFPIELPSIASIPNSIMMASENIDNTGGRIIDSKTFSPSLFLVNSTVDKFVVERELLTDDQLMSTLHPDVVAGTEILNPFLDTIREASLAYSRGETISASILYASSIEILLDTLLLFMMWEEGVYPHMAYETMYGTKMCGCENCKIKMTTTLDRVNGGMYLDRIGGDWSKKSALMEKWRAVAELRNRVVHTGFEPDLKQVEANSQIVREIQTVVSDYVSKSMARYPLTGYFFVGQDGLRRRGMSPDLNEYIAEEEYKPVSMQSLFLRWQFEVERCSSTKLQKTRDDACKLGYLLHNSGKRRWILFDEKLKLLRLINDQEAKPGITASIESIEQKIVKEKLSQSVILEITDMKPVVKTARMKWYPMYIISATMHAIDRWPKNYMLPEE